MSGLRNTFLKVSDYGSKAGCGEVRHSAPDLLYELTWEQALSYLCRKALFINVSELYAQIEILGEEARSELRQGLVRRRLRGEILSLMAAELC